MEETNKKGFLRQTIKGTATAIVISLVLVLLFAFILDVTGLSEKAIKPINQVIKLLAVTGGCLFAVRGEKGFLKGGIIGLASIALSQLIFGLIAGGIGSPIGIIVDIVCGLILGVIAGAISVNLFSLK